MKLNEFLENLNLKSLVRPYTEQEKLEEYSELDTTEEYPDDIKKEIKKKLQDISLTFLNIDEPVSNTDAFDIMLDSVDKGDQIFKNNTFEDNRWQTLKKATKVPPPVVINYKNQNRLLGGNKRAVLLNIKAKEMGYNQMPVYYVKV